MCADFAEDKVRVLGGVDLSRKGSVDAAILPLVGYLNRLDCYYSTSSCSGRLVLFEEGEEQKKKGCCWLLVSHDLLEPAQLEEVLRCERLGEHRGYIYFKFEPFVLHVMCATLSDARLMLQTAVASGFRNSGLSCGKKERWMVAVRSTHSLEVPLAHDNTRLTTTEYLRHVVDIGNAKLRENLQRVDRFHRELTGAIERRRRDRDINREKIKSYTSRRKTTKQSDSSHLIENESETDDEIATLFS